MNEHNLDPGLTRISLEYAERSQEAWYRTALRDVPVYQTEDLPAGARVFDCNGGIKMERDLQAEYLSLVRAILRREIGDELTEAEFDAAFTNLSDQLCGMLGTAAAVMRAGKEMFGRQDQEKQK